MAQRIQFVETEIPSQDIFDVPNDVNIYVAQLMSSINVLESKYIDLLQVLGLMRDSVYGQGAHMKLMGKFLTQMAIPLDCLDVSCKSCLRRCDGLNHVAHGLESLSQIQSEKNFKLLENIIDFLQLQIDIFKSTNVKLYNVYSQELLLRREKTIEEINLPRIIQKIESGTSRIAELRLKQGFEADIQKLKLLLDQVKQWSKLLGIAREGVVRKTNCFYKLLYLVRN